MKEAPTYGYVVEARHRYNSRKATQGHCLRLDGGKKKKSHVPIHAPPQDRPRQWILDNAPRFPPNNPDVSEPRM